MATQLTSFAGRVSVVACFAIAVSCGVSPVVADDGGVVWSTDVETSLQRAAAEQRPVLMEFTASWCVYCKRMEKTTFVDPAIVNAVNDRFIAVKVDADIHKTLVKDLGIKGLPAMLLVAPDLQIIDRISGFQTAEALLARLEQVEAPTIVNVTPQAREISRPTSFNGEQPVAMDPVAGRGQQPAPADFAGQPVAPVAPTAAANPFAASANPAASPNPFAALPAEPRSDTAGRVTLNDAYIAAAPSPVPTPEAHAVTFHDPAPQANVAFNGACPVTAIDTRKLTPGKDAYEIEYRGQTVRFASLEARISFESDPEKYWPMLDGVCPVALAETGAQSSGDLRFAVLFRKRIWLLQNEASMNAFVADPGVVVQEALTQLQQANFNTIQ